ncbi:venom dipeptidyl peptidase 4-like isoform X2 [Leptopilina boulardi]|nr:venom dipeptidyl peptidase 4-like isoform X2 [Leptopilina boulardi]
MKRLTNKRTEVKWPKEINPRSYFVGCQWFEDYATVAITSRDFQTTWYLSCTYQKPSGKCKILWTKDWTLTKGYSDILSAGFNDGDKLITVTPSNSEKSTSQIIMINTTNVNIHSLTTNCLFVMELVRWDKVQEIVYYIASKISKPDERHLYKSFFGNQSHLQVYCLTCDDNSDNPSKNERNRWPTCHYSSVTFSPKGSYYLLDCLDDKGDLKNLPETFIVSTKSNMIVLTLDNRQIEEDNYKKVFYDVPKFKFFQCPIADGKYNARIKLQLPPNFTSDKKYSLIVGVDSRIGSQQVNRKWKIDVGTYASIEKEYIYAVADVRGSGYQGYEFESELYNNIGNPEVDDLLEVLHWMLNKLPYIDSDNVFVQGEQYGGMVAILIALKEPNLIKAIAIYHPPLFWNGTSAFFAERLLGLPTLDDNYFGYKAKSIGENVNRYRDMKILIVMDMSTNSGGHSQQISMMRDKINNESYHFEFLNVI